jgi:NAD(P)H-quinone oxidoreductase subunit 5
VPISLALVAAVAWAGGALIGIAVPHLVVMWVAALGLAPLLWPLEERGLRALPRGAARVVGVAALGLGGHALAQAVVAAPVHAHAAILAVPAAALLLTLYVVQAWVLAYPRGALSRRLHPHVYAGFHLDESFTRIALRWWPAPIPTPARPHPLTEPTGDPA